MAESISLAVMENLVHMSREDFPSGFVIVAAVIPDHLRIVTEEALRKQFPTKGQRELGDLWIDSVASAVLRVRSAVIIHEYNYLLNPKHPNFSEVSVETAVPFVFDERLFRLRDNG